MHLLRLLLALIKINIQITLAYRTEALVNLLLNIMWLGWDLLSLSIIFNNTATLAGWGPGEMIALLGVFRFVNTWMVEFVWPNTEKFNTSIRDGSFDYTLLQPANSLLMVSTSRIVIWRIWEFLLAIGLIVVGVRMSDLAGSLSLISFLVLGASGLLVIYSLWIVLIGLTFWFIKFDNNVTILQALLEAGRYPVTVYPPWLRLIVTFIVPIAVATTIPLQGLRGELDLGRVFFFLGVGIASFLMASGVWKAGLRRYSGASS